MKKRLLLCIVLATLSFVSFGQQLISFGPKVGINYSTVTGFSDLMDRGKTNFVGGVYAEVRPLKWLGASIEALYSAEGFVTKEFVDLGQGYSLDMSLGYIAIPIMARIYVVGGLSVNVGYQPSFLVSSQITIANTSSLETTAEPFSSTIPVGVSYSFDFGLMLDLRYNIGLSDVNPLDISSEHMQNRTWSLSAGWKF